MDKIKLEQFVEQHLVYIDKLERHQKRPQIKPCEFCNNTATDQTIQCIITLGRHFRHRCSSCRRELYNGAKRADRWPNPIYERYYAEHRDQKTAK